MSYILISKYFFFSPLNALNVDQWEKDLLDKIKKVTEANEKELAKRKAMYEGSAPSGIEEKVTQALGVKKDD